MCLHTQQHQQTGCLFTPIFTPLLSGNVLATGLAATPGVDASEANAANLFLPLVMPAV
jgi:hypothetical protein